MITLGEMWAITKAKPLLALFWLALGGLIGCIAEVETRPVRCATSFVREVPYTVCEDR